MACIARNGPWCSSPVGEIRDHPCSHGQLKQKSEVISTYYIFHRSAYVNSTLHIQLHNSLPEASQFGGLYPESFGDLISWSEISRVFLRSLQTEIPRYPSMAGAKRAKFTPTDRFPPRNACFKKTTKQLGKSNWLITDMFEQQWSATWNFW